MTSRKASLNFKFTRLSSFANFRNGLFGLKLGQRRVRHRSISFWPDLVDCGRHSWSEHLLWIRGRVVSWVVYWTLVVMTILDLDRPERGFIRNSHRPLLNLRQSMK